MTDATQAVVGTSFAPKTLVPVSVGRTTVNLYPVVDTTMQVHERAHAFQINKTALSLQAIELRVMLDALGAQLNLSASVEGMIEEWLRFFQDSWFDFSLLQILSFHNNAGGQVNDTTTATDRAILLPLQEWPIADCRKPIKFVQVQLNLNYAVLANVNPPSPAVLRATYYIELLLTLCALTNGGGGQYSITTFVSPSDLRTLSPQDLRAQILDLTIQGGPLDCYSQASTYNRHGRTRSPCGWRSIRRSFALQCQQSVTHSSRSWSTFVRSTRMPQEIKL